MKKKLNIMMGDKPLRLDPESCIDVEVQNPLLSNKPMFSSSAWPLHAIW